jgi:hypothetical protein
VDKAKEVVLRGRSGFVGLLMTSVSPVGGQDGGCHI